MESDYGTVDESLNSGRKIIMHPLYLPRTLPWLDLKVFYVRVSNIEADDSMPENLTLNHVPLTPDTIIEMNGRRSSIYSDWVSSVLRRDRVDRTSEEVTFVSTDSIRINGSVRFEVCHRDDMLLCGVLELSDANGYIGEAKNHGKKWSMKCQQMKLDGTCFLKGKQHLSPESASPTVEVYVAACFSGTPIILTKTLQPGFRKKHQMKLVLDSIPEHETSLQQKLFSEDDLQSSEYQAYKRDTDDIDYSNMYSREDYIEREDGELSWFNAGVRVGVGIGLGICLGVGIGVGVLVRTYQATTNNFRRRLI